MPLVYHVIHYLFYGIYYEYHIVHLLKYVDRLRLTHSHEQSHLALVRKVEMRLFKF
jgi:hypothetical protein